MQMKEKLISFRKEAGFTQQQIAELLGLDRSTYSCYETGKVRVPLRKLQQLAVIYNLDLNAFDTSAVLHLCSDMAKENEKLRMKDLTREERMFLAKMRMLKSDGKLEALEEAMNKLSQDED